MDLYRDYIAEREHKVLVLDTNDHGFLTYKVLGDCIYIVDLFVKQEFRKSGVAKKMADHVSEIAISMKKPALLGSVSPSDPNVTENLKVFLGYGMKIHNVTPEIIYLIKHLEPQGEK
jgi:predicted GNAT family acetyltransferase